MRWRAELTHSVQKQTKNRIRFIRGYRKIWRGQYIDIATVWRAYSSSHRRQYASWSTEGEWQAKRLQMMATLWHHPQLSTPPTRSPSSLYLPMLAKCNNFIILIKMFLRKLMMLGGRSRRRRDNCSQHRHTENSLLHSCLIKEKSLSVFEES